MGATSELSSGSALLGGARVLVVEDDFFIALELASILSDAGAEIVGPSQTVAGALDLADDELLSAAILDIRLGDDTVGPVADMLAAHGVPFVFYTGQARADPLRAEWPDCEIIEKPALPVAIVRAVAALLDRPTATLHTR
jgi:DNA-binding NtrC family response regulator